MDTGRKTRQLGLATLCTLALSLVDCNDSPKPVINFKPVVPIQGLAKNPSYVPGALVNTDTAAFGNPAINVGESKYSFELHGSYAGKSYGPIFVSVHSDSVTKETIHAAIRDNPLATVKIADKYFLRYADWIDYDRVGQDNIYKYEQNDAPSGTAIGVKASEIIIYK